MAKLFHYYKQLGEQTFDQLQDDQLFLEPEEGINSIAIIVNHIVGNMLSRWTDFLTADGEKEWRHRDMEFEDVLKTKEELMAKWEKGWQCLFDALDTINEENIGTIVYIRNQGHTVTEAVHRQLAHYAYHVGQIVYLGKLFNGTEWNSLSIPKNESVDYNKQRFDQDRTTKHFTEDIG